MKLRVAARFVFHCMPFIGGPVMRTKPFALASPRPVRAAERDGTCVDDSWIHATMYAMSEERRLVAVAALLGFTETIRTQPLSSVVAGPVAFVRRCLRHSSHQSGWPSDYLPTLAEIRAQNRVGVAWFSDTILLYALSDGDEHAKAVVETAAWLQFETFHGVRTALRIGIDYDEFYADAEASVFVGKALVNAYHLEEAQEWVGGALTPEAAARVRATGDESYLADYNVPFREESRRSATLAWIEIPHQPSQLRFEPLAQALADAANESIRQSIRRKWRNAKVYHDSQCEICRLNCRGA
jgi:hypothetical protein